MWDGCRTFTFTLENVIFVDFSRARRDASRVVVSTTPTGNACQDCAMQRQRGGELGCWAGQDQRSSNEASFLILPLELERF